MELLLAEEEIAGREWLGELELLLVEEGITCKGGEVAC